MPRRYKDRRYSRRRSNYDRQMSRFNSSLRRHRNQLLVLAVAVLVIIILILRADLANKSNGTPAGLSPEFAVSTVYVMDRSVPDMLKAQIWLG